MAKNPLDREQIKKLYEELQDSYENGESSLDKIIQNHENIRESLIKKSNDRRSILLYEIQKSSYKKYLDELLKIDKENVSARLKLLEDTVDLTERRIKDSLEALSKSEAFVENINKKLSATRQEINVLRAGIKEGLLDDNAKDDLRELYIEQFRLESELRLKKEEEEKALSEYKKKLIDEETKKRKEDLEELRKKGLSEDQERSEREQIESNYQNNIEDIINGGRFGKLFGSEIGSTLSDIIHGKGTGNEKLSNLADVGIDKLSESHPVIGTIVKTVKNGFDMLQKALKENVDEAMKTYSKYMGRIDTRLQGSEKYFEDMMETVQHNLTANTWVNQKQYVENLNQLVEKGIAYNLEERTLLMTVGDRIATTFDTLDENLLRLIRLQQTDMTRSALGSEASLTNFLNQYFNDTSYLSDQYDSVTSNLIEATSQMNVDQATAFTYAVQKWLGALYSVGMSGQAVQTIAQGLSYLSTGNVSALASSPNLQTLMGLVSSDAGLPISSLLTQGLSANNVNDLMKSMVEYLSDIANNTSNQVLRSQWADILNLSLSDIRAMSNLTPEDIQNIYGDNLNYSGANNYLNNQLSYIGKRTTIQQKLDNAYENFMFTYGMNIADNDVQYLAYNLPKYTEKLQDLFEGTLLKPAIDTIDLIASAIGAVASGIGLGETGVEFFRSLFGNGAFNVDLDRWNSSQYNIGNRGEGFLGLSDTVVASETARRSPLAGSTFSTSNSRNYSTNAAREAGTQTMYFEQVENQIRNSASTISGSNEEVIATIDKLYSMLFEKQTTAIRVKLASFEDEASDSISKIVSKNKDELSSDLERYMNNSSQSVDNLMRTLYSVRGV